MKRIPVLALVLQLGCNEGHPPSGADSGTTRDPRDAGPTAPGMESDASVPSPPPLRWRALFDDLDAPVLSVWGTSLEQAFFVGERGLVLQRDDDAWFRWEVPTEEALWWVWGRSMRDVFVGGEGGTLLHFDGSSWRQLDSGLDRAETVWGIWGQGDDVWAVGGRASTNGPGFVLHAAGDEWSRLNTGEMPNLYKVWGSGEDPAFVVGDDSSLYRLLGDDLDEQDLGSAGDNIEPLFTVAGNESGVVFAVGGVSQGLGFELGVNGFELVPLPTAGLNGVSVTPSGAVTVVGLFGVIRERAAGEWLTQDLETERHYHATCAFEDGAYAVGGDLLSSGSARRGLIAVRGDLDTPAPPVVVLGEGPGPVDAGAGDAGLADAASIASDAGARRDGGKPNDSFDAGADAGDGGAPAPLSDSGADAGLDAAAPDAGGGFPGPSEFCTDDFKCAPGLECWYLQGESELRCVQMCEAPSECGPAFGPDPQCAPPGCQTVLGACLRAEWVGCFL